MARFYAAIRGNRGEATRMGTASSGLDAHIRGWGIGARVEMDVDPETGTDRVTIWRTGGSNRCGDSKLVYQETLNVED